MALRTLFAVNVANALMQYMMSNRPFTTGHARKKYSVIDVFHRAALGLVLAAPVAAQQPILIGQTIATTGSLGEHGRGLVLGALAHFDSVNQAGGINGRPIELRTLDDGGDGVRAGVNTSTLARDPAVLAIFSGAEGGPPVLPACRQPPLRVLRR